VDAINGRHPRVAARLAAHSPDEVCVSSVVVAELRYGADKSARPRENHARIDLFVHELRCLDFDLGAAAAYGRIRSELERGGRPIGPNDMLIAAQALSRDLILVTDNLREFSRIKGLRLENWRE
jgi:tRNA(fMet)-specific endonuclease VapC